MEKGKESNSDFAGRELFISRVLNAPVELVWEVFVTPEHIKNWWGPNGFTNTIYKMEVRPGGEWDFMMHGPDGTNFPNKAVFIEVIKHQLIVFQHNAPNFVTTINFVADGNKTLIKWHMVFESKELFEAVVKNHKADKGLEQNIEKLEVYLATRDKTAGDEYLTVTRIFNAPQELVFKAFSEREHLEKWWGPAGMEMCSTKLDFRPGGVYHYGMKSPEGYMMWGLFKYVEIHAPEKVIFINCFSDQDGNVTRAPFNPNWPLEVMNIMTFTRHEGKTTLTLKAKPINATAAEQKAFNEMQAGMQQGFGGTFNQLELYLPKIK